MPSFEEFLCVASLAATQVDRIGGCLAVESIQSRDERLPRGLASDGGEIARPVARGAVNKGW